MKINNFYHSTNQANLLDILKSKKLSTKNCLRIGGLNSDYVYLSDLYHQYLSVVFGSVIIQFKAKALLAKNSIIPTVYDQNDKEFFLDMPFEEAEWSSEEVIFNYDDIEKIIFVVSAINDGEIAGVIGSIMEHENISRDWIDQTKMPDYSNEICLQRYYERVKNYAI